jgi:hypothetical protein
MNTTKSLCASFILYAKIYRRKVSKLCLTRVSVCQWKLCTEAITKFIILNL